MWRPFVSLLVSVLGAVLLLRSIDSAPTPHLSVRLATPVLVQALVIAIPPGPLATAPPVIDPDWAVASAHPRPSHRPTLIARASTRRAIALHTQPAPPRSPIGRMFAWLASHAVRTSLRNDELQGG